jgi:hypothetical protein
MGFKYATDLGFSFGMKDCNVDFDIKSRIKEIEEKIFNSTKIIYRD